MAHVANKPNTNEQIRSLQEQVRRLRTRGHRKSLEPFVDGRGYLCDGWVQDYISEPPENTNLFHFGFYRSDTRVHWRGTLFWNPPAAILANAADVNDPLNDAVNLCVPLVDGLGNVSTTGAVIPRRYWPDTTMIAKVPVDSFNTGAPYTRGRWAELLITWDGIVKFNPMYGPSPTSGTDNLPRDAANRVHMGIPYFTYLNFDQLSYRPRFP